MEGWVRELRYSARGLLRSPGFTAVAVASLALGIGVNSGVFSLVNAVLLKPMPVESPEELVALYATRSGERFPSNFSYPNYRDMTDGSIFSALVGFHGAPVSMNADGEPELVWSEMATGNYFEGLGVRMAAGRGFRAEEGDVPGHTVAVLGHDFWRRRFAEDGAVVGRLVKLNGHDFTIIGVASSGFTGAKFLGFTPDLWVPLAMHRVVLPGSEGLLERRGGGWLQVRGRLARGVSLEKARAALTAVSARLESEYPEVNEGWEVHALPAPRKTEPFVDVMTGGAIPVASAVLLALVGMVLLVACANVASLELARAFSREKEIAVRLSLGATRGRLARQLLIESFLLALLGGALGLLLGERLLAASVGLNPTLDFSVDYSVSFDARVLGYTVLASLLAGVLSGLMPALRAGRRDLVSSLKETSSRTRRWGGRRLLVVPQLALSLVALVSAGLLVRSFQNVRASRPGFATEGLLFASVNLDLQGYDASRQRAFHRDLLDRMRRLAGVESASIGFPLPLDAYSEGERVAADGGGVDLEKEGILALSSVVAPGYFETMDTALVHGRGFREDDDERSARVAILNETLARELWPDENALGKRIRLDGEETPRDVVGVARDGKYVTLGEERQPYVFLPLFQRHQSPITLLLRTNAPPKSLEESVRAEVEALDPTLPVFGVRSVSEFLERSIAAPRGLALSVSFFAVLAIVLSTLGVYGLMSFSVSSKRHETGIRMALGATRRDVLFLFVREAGTTIASGLLLGLALAFLTTRVLESLLFGVSAQNLGIFAAVAALLAAVALAGGVVPTRTATRIDPVRALRHE